MGIKCVQNFCAKEFLKNNEDHLLQRESENNFILGFTNSLIRKQRECEDPLFFTIFDNDKIIGQALRTYPNKPLVISNIQKNAIEALVSKLIDMKFNLSGVIGPMASSKGFADFRCQLLQLQLELEMHQGVYELTQVIHPIFENGEMIVATDMYQNIVYDFILGFINDCFPNDKDPTQRATEIANRHIKNSTVFLWKNSNGEIVSMAAKNRESKNAATISLVYTPKEHRGKGYGSCVVAKLSQKLLSDGKTKCNLLTDLSNPISNSIYQKIGYNFLGESQHFNFK